MTSTLLLVLLSLAGTSLAARLPYIIGGRDADITHFPWQGSLRRYDSHTCGCSLISTTWAVTAAHCVSGVGFTVGFGSNNRHQVTTKTVSQIFVHERWGSGAGSYPNDIAVLKFTAYQLSDKIQTIKLATTDQAGNHNCYITGWGHTTLGYKVIPDILQQGHVDVYTNSECKSIWPSSSINDGHVCTGTATIGACQGDSGGPLACYVGSSGSYELVGVTSWVRTGCYTTHPSVYTRVSYFREWIRGKTGV